MKKEELKKEYENGTVVITKDNIHLYYEFMSDEDKYTHSDLIHKILILERQFQVFKQLEINVNDESTWKKIQEKHIEKQIENKRTEWVTDLKIFGIKDILKPIDEYIAEIKASSEYKKYLFSLDTFENWIIKSLFNNANYSIKLNDSLIVDKDFIYYTPTNKKQNGGTVKATNIKLPIPDRFKTSSEYKEYIAESKESNIEFLEYIVKSTSFTKVNFTTTKVIFDKYTDEIKNNYQRINTILKELIDGFNSFEFVAENGNLVFNYQWDENFSGNGFIKISEIKEAYKEYISTK